MDCRSRYLYIVLGGYLRILGASSLQLFASYRYLLPIMYLFMADIVCVWLSDLDVYLHHPLL